MSAKNPPEEPQSVMSEEHRRRLREGVRRHWDDPEAAERHRRGLRGKQSPETIEKKRAKQLAYWQRRRAAEAARPKPDKDNG